MSDAEPTSTSDQFLAYLVALLSQYKLKHRNTIYRSPFHGHPQWPYDSILTSLAEIGNRMWTAEEELRVLKGRDSPDGSKSKKRRSVELDDASDSDSRTPNISYHRAPSATTLTDSTAGSGSLSSGEQDGRRTSPDSATTDFDMCDTGSTILPNQDLDSKPCAENGRRFTKRSGRRRKAPMTISLEGLKTIDHPEKIFERDPKTTSSHSMPATTTGEHAMCRSCGRMLPDGFPLQSEYAGSGEGSPLVVPPGPLMAAAYESGMSAVEELKLLKTQVQDVSRVCQAVARGDLTQYITVPVQGVPMIQLKDVINTMVCICSLSPPYQLDYFFLILSF